MHDAGVDYPVRARLLATGPFEDDDLGVACYHSKTGAVELYLNHLVDGPGEYVVVDCTAGADSFASGLFTRFDLTVLVAEPTRKGISVYRQWQGYAAGRPRHPGRRREQGLRREQDVAFLRSQARHRPGDLARPRTRRQGHGAGTALQPLPPERQHVGRARPAPGHARRPAQGLVPVR